LVERADVVVSSLELHRESSRKVVAALRLLYPGTPVVLQGPHPMFAQWAPLFEGHWGSVEVPANKRTLLDSVESALAMPVEETKEDVDDLKFKSNDKFPVPTRLRPDLPHRSRESFLE